MPEAFIAAFTLALISEIADKTQLVILGLALKYRSPFKVFSGALLAHALMDGSAIILGLLFGFSLSSTLIKNVIGILFIVLGIWSFVKIYLNLQKKEDKEKKRTLRGIFSKAPLTASFLTVLLSEFGDKTQIASGLLAAKYLVIIPIFIGFVMALAIVIGLTVFVGRKIAERVPGMTIRIVTASMFILFGVFTLLS